MLDRYKHSYPEFQVIPYSITKFGFDWTGWLLAGETITGSSWTVTNGALLTLAASAGGNTSVFVDGVVAGNFYRLTNTVTTSTRTGVSALVIECS